MPLRPAIRVELAMFCLALARPWDGQSASSWHRRAGPGRRGALRLARAGPGPRSLLDYGLPCQAVSDPSLGHSRKRRTDCRWQWGPESSIQATEARDDRRPGTRQGRVEQQSQVEESDRAPRRKRAFAGTINDGEEQPARASPGLVQQAGHGRRRLAGGARLEPTQSPAAGPGWHCLVSGRPARRQSVRALPVSEVTVACRSRLLKQAGRRPTHWGPRVESAIITDGGLVA